MTAAFGCATKCLMRQSSTEFSQLLVKAGRGVWTPLWARGGLDRPCYSASDLRIQGRVRIPYGALRLDEGTEALLPDLLNRGSNST